MKTAILCAAIAGLITAAANAADITWQTPTTISGTLDVSTLGLYFGSWAPQNGGANTLPVNGVTFQGFSDLPSLTPDANWDNGFNGFGSPGTTDGNYNSLLQFARFSNETGPVGFSWSGMTAGDTYLVEFWVNDGRNIGQSRSETLTGGSLTSSPLLFGSDGSGAGQFIIGTFVADSSGSQTIIVNPFSSGANPSSQINLFQVRDISTVPEPSTLAFFAAGAGTMLLVVRRQQRS